MRIDGPALPVQIGIGVLSDGEHELLGVWHVAIDGKSMGCSIVDDLRDRGVEAINIAISADPGLHAALRESYSAITLRSSIHDVIHVPNVEAHQLPAIPKLRLSARHKLALRDAEEMATRLRRRLSSAMAHLARMSDPLVARSFAIEVITRAHSDLQTVVNTGLIKRALTSSRLD